ncbi:MAG: hypothetical protein V2A77_08895 [Pseudomonadota bacterium]
MLKRYLLYILRWQLSTPILAGVLIVLASFDQWTVAVIANLIGALIFFWVDRVIFTFGPRRSLNQVGEPVVGATSGGSRVGLGSAGSEPLQDPKQEPLCPSCLERRRQQR